MMNKKKAFSLFLLVLLTLSLVQLVAAQGIFSQPGMKPLRDAFSAQYDWPPFGPGPKEQISLGIVILTWIALFGLLYVLINVIPVFKDSPHKNAVMWFTFALSGVAVTSTGFVGMVAGLVGISSVIFYIFSLFALIILVVSWFGQLSSGQAEGFQKSRAAAEIQRRRSDRVSREGLQERQTWDKEDKAVQQAENLIVQDIKVLGSIEEQIQHLIDIITQITQVRDQGAALRLKQQFHRQAAAVASEITRNIKLDAQIKKLDAEVTQLEHVEVNFLTKLDDEVRVAATTVARKAGIQTWFSNHDAAIRKFRAEQQRLLAEMQPLVTTVPNLAQEIEDAMEAVIRDVNNNQYPEAINNLNQALNNARREQSILTNIAGLLARSQKTLRGIQAALNDVRHIPP